MGNVIFNTIYAMVKVMAINHLGGYEKYADNWLLSFRETILLYFILFLIFAVTSIFTKKTTIHKLNDKLKNMKKRGEEDEK